MKKVAVIEYNLKDYIIETFKNHKADEYELSYFVEWKKQSESNDEYLIKSISDIKNDDYDILLIAVRENRYLSRLLTYLHDRNLTRIYVVRLFAMDKKLDFISDKDSYIDVIPERDDKPYLVHLETHVCDHCNLNCKACNNFAPFVKEPTYADLGQFENDLKNLRKLFSAIGRFFLLGGEPLLAPELCCDMIRIYRKYYPINELRILTNATLILTMKSEFWECLRENNVIIHISLYPPVKKQIAKIEQKLIEEKIQYLVFKEVTRFLKHWTKYPFEDEVYNNNVCGSGGCHYLRNGKISKCPDAIMIERMETDLKSKDDISLTDDISARGVLRKLDSPIDLCKKCTYKRSEVVEWQQVDENVDENGWIIKHFYEAENEKLMKYNHDLKERVEGQKVEIAQLKEIMELLKESVSCKEQDLKNIIYEKNQLGYEIKRLNNSYSYRLGLCITLIPRKIIKLISGIYK
jgi:hypothetical protein